MTELFKPQPREVLLNWLEAIESEASDKLTAWEIDFITSVRMKVDAGYALTESQQNTLERIYAENTN